MAAYLPHNAIVQVIREDESVDYVNLNASQASLILDDYHFNPKLVLRPIGDLWDEIEHDSESFEPLVILADNCDTDSEREFIEAVSFDPNRDILQYCPVSLFSIILEWKFDVFGLIPNILAISVHDLPENPYQ